MASGTTNAIASSSGGSITVNGQKYEFQLQNAFSSCLVPLSLPPYQKGVSDIDSTETYGFSLNVSTYVLTKYLISTGATVTSVTLPAPEANHYYFGIKCYGDKVYVFTRQYASGQYWVYIYSRLQSNLSYVATSPLIYNLYETALANSMVFESGYIVMINSGSQLIFYDANTLSYVGVQSGIQYIKSAISDGAGGIIGIGGGGNDVSDAQKYLYKVNVSTRVGTVCATQAYGITSLTITPTFVVAILQSSNNGLIFFDKATFLSAINPMPFANVTTIADPDGSTDYCYPEYVHGLSDTMALITFGDEFGASGTSSVSNKGKRFVLFNPSAQKVESTLYFRTASPSMFLPPRWVESKKELWMRPYSVSNISPTATSHIIKFGKTISSILVEA